MEKTKKRKMAIALFLLLVISTTVQCLILGNVAVVKRQKKVSDATSYGQIVADAIQQTLDNSLEATETLKYFYVTYGEDMFDDFDTIGKQIMEDHPLIESLYIAPKGIVEKAYPKEVNASTIGFAMLEDPEQGPRAQLAVDTRKITVAGPHELVEGGVGFIIRNPIFNGDEFVGFTIIVMNWEKLVEQVLEKNSISQDLYKLAVWKESIDETAVTDSDGFILRNSNQSISRKVDISFEVPNDTWHLVVEPVDGWKVYRDMWGQIGSTIIIASFLVALLLFYFSSAIRKDELQRQIGEKAATEKYMQQIQNSLRQAEAANNAKTVFLNNMSHDIRTPMNAILGFARLIDNNASNEDAVKNYIAKIEDSGEYLLSILNNVLDMARIESGKFVLNEEPYEVAGKTEYMFALFEEDIKKKNLEVTRHIDIQHKYAFADEARIGQILINLLSNAVKYTPNGGKIYFEAIELPQKNKKYGIYQVTVQDTGIGMSKEFQEVLFDSFTRERTSTDSKIMGTGLGMSIVKKLVDLMKGTITVESELGKGSKFVVTLTLPLTESPEKFQESSKKKQSVSLPAGKRILLAEDNDLNAEIGKEVLHELGFEVDRAADGVECVSMLSESEPGYYSLILMDIQMPNLDGYSATIKIRNFENKKLASIPIIAMTANAFEEDKKHAYSVGMNGHLAKPIEVPKLVETLADILSTTNE